MSIFLNYSPENGEYLLTPAGYGFVILVFFAVFAAIHLLNKPSHQSRRLKTIELVTCAGAMALAMVTSFLKLASLPFGGSITLFSMLFICLTGYFFGLKTALLTGIAYGILQFIVEPYIFTPLQAFIDYPLAFGALGLSGLFYNKKYGLVTGCVTGILGRYFCHVISGYVFFAAYAPENMNPLIYTLIYNASYIFPELLATVFLVVLPPVANAIAHVKRQVVNS